MDKSADFYVSPDGSDSNDGTKLSPFATLARAKVAVRGLLRNGSDNDITVFVREGVYQLEETLVFNLEDSSSTEAHITYKAYPGENPVISGGKTITGWNRVDPETPELPESAKEHVWATDLPQLNGSPWIFSALFDAEGLLTRAHSPRYHTAKDEVELTSRPPKEHRHRLRELHFEPGDMKEWRNLADVELFLTPRNPWTVNYLPLESVDVGKGIAKTTLPGTYPLISHGGWDIIDAFYQVENVIDFLDKPGTWVLDSAAGRVYLWPRTPEPGDTIVAPTLTELIRFAGDLEKNRWVRNITISGFTFSHGDRMRFQPDRESLQHDWEQYDEPNAMVRLRGAEGIEISDSRFESSGSSGVRLDLHATDNRVCRNEMTDIGGAGIVLAGYGPGSRDENHHNEITHNHIHHAARLWWHSPGIFLSQSGHNRIANNLIHNMPYCGLVMSGLRSYVFDMTADQERHFVKYDSDDKAWTEGYRTIRFDEVAHVPFDQGRYTMVDTPSNTHSPVEGIFRLGFAHSRYNVVEHNEIHHVMESMGDGNAVYVSGTGWGNILRRNYFHDIEGAGNVSALRLDDESFFTLVTENVIWRINGTGLTNKNINIIENNIVVDCYGGPPHGYLACRHIGPCYGAGLRRNILFRPDSGREDQQEFFHITPLFKEASFDTNVLYCERDPAQSEAALKDLEKINMGQRCISADPLFVDAEHGDFRLKSESPAIAIGFRPFDEWGLTDEVGPFSKNG